MRHLAYDADVNLRDVVLLASPLHVEFVRALLDWTRAPQLNLRLRSEMCWAYANHAFFYRGAFVHALSHESQGQEPQSSMCMSKSATSTLRCFSTSRSILEQMNL